MSDASGFEAAFERVFEACRAVGDRDGPSGTEVSERQMMILAHLDPAEPTMVGELAEYLGVTASTMSLTLKRLEARGLVSRSRDPDDRRVTNVRRTDAGSEAAARRRLLSRARVERLLDRLDPLARARALDGLRLLAEAAGAAAPHDPTGGTT